MFATLFFSISKISPRSFSSSRQQNDVKLKQPRDNKLKNPEKKTRAQTNLQISGKMGNETRKVMSGSQICGLQTSCAAHPYYIISLCWRQRKLYESSVCILIYQTKLHFYHCRNLCFFISKSSLHSFSKSTRQNCFILQDIRDA